MLVHVIFTLASNRPEFVVAHVEQAVEPSLLEWLPEVQAVHLSDRFALEKDPASQRMQAVAKAKEKDPAMHGMHVLEPSSLENFPAAHTLHAACEVNLEPGMKQPQGKVLKQESKR